MARDKAMVENLRDRGIIRRAEDLGIDPRLATRDLLAARSVTVPASAINRLSAGIGRGVVVTASSGEPPSRSPNLRFDSTISGRRQAQNSSAQAA